MAGSIRICLIADNFIEDFAKCVSSIRSYSNVPITIFASGKELASYQERFKDENVIFQKNKLGWGHSINYFLNNSSEKYLVIMDPSTIFTSDAITPTLEQLDKGYQAVGWRGGLVNVDDQWRSVDDKGAGEVDVLFSYFLALDRQFALSAEESSAEILDYLRGDR